MKKIFRKRKKDRNIMKLVKGSSLPDNKFSRYHEGLYKLGILNNGNNR